jgi:hypothetical protein
MTWLFSWSGVDEMTDLSSCQPKAMIDVGVNCIGGFSLLFLQKMVVHVDLTRGSEGEFFRFPRRCGADVNQQSAGRSVFQQTGLQIRPRD